MDTNYIGSPKNFRRIGGINEDINFRHTFDLNGTQNDEMLRLYLRSAGLSDEIECLTAEQRRAFIYDIIKSNKLPGYWLPSTFNKNSYYTMQRPAVRPPPPPMPISPTPSPYAERKIQNSSPSLSFATTIRSAASSSSLQSLDRASPLLAHRFIPAPAVPPSPTSFVTSAKGNRYEISGPMNFQHTAGDMTRDRTRNAFDLSASDNDNVLRKYMMERGITEEDVDGMRKTDIIRKIVQSKFTWMPKKQINPNIEQQLNYATVSSNNDTYSISSSPSYEELSITSIISTATTPSPKPSPPATLAKPKTDFSNYTLITSRFADSSQFPTPSDIYGNRNDCNINVPTTVALPPLPPNAKRPAPPPRKSQQSTTYEYAFSEQAPPPPSTVKAKAQDDEIIYSTRISLDYDNTFQTIPIQRNNSNENQQYMQPNTFWQLTEPLYVTTQKQTKFTAFNHAPRTAANMPPPPLPPPSNTNMIVDHKMQQSSFNIQNAMPAATAEPQQYPQVSRNTIMKSPPPLPPPTYKRSSVGMPPPPTPPLQNLLAASTSPSPTPTPPPPPPPPPVMDTMEQAFKQYAPSAGDDGRDALMESIRKGVSLKKVNATISGVKQRDERNPPVIDFISELKMGITLRRIKNPEDNPFTTDEFDESHA